MPIRQDAPEPWAVAREQEGWPTIGVGDHLWMERIPGIDHPFVALGVIAACTRNVGITTLFMNNLLRSPVELAQGALTVHAASGGRFELGVGAGWSKGELARAGIPYPDPRERARRFKEANPDAKVGLSVYVAVGSGAAVDNFEKVYEPGVFAGLAGPPARVADALQAIAGRGVDRITVIPLAGEAADIAPLLIP